MNQERRTRQPIRLTPRGERLIAFTKALGIGIIATGFAFGLIKHAQDIDDFYEQRERSKQPISVEAVLSDDTTVHKAKAGDTVWGMASDYTNIKFENPVTKEIATDATVDAIKKMPENTVVLSDNTLQIGENLTLPIESTVLPE